MSDKQTPEDSGQGAKSRRDMLRAIGTAAASVMAMGVMGASPAEACFDGATQQKRIAGLLTPQAAEKLSPLARGLTGGDVVVLSARRAGVQLPRGAVAKPNEELIKRLTVTDLKSVETAFLTQVVVTVHTDGFCCCCCCCCAVAQSGPRPVRIR